MNNSCCCISSPAFGAVSILDFGHSDRCVVITHFDLGSPKDVEHLFLCVFAICGSSLMMCLLGLCSINLGVQTSLQIWAVLCCYFFKNTLCLLLHLFFLWDSTNSQIVSFNHVPQIMWPFSTLFHSFFFLLCLKFLSPVSQILSPILSMLLLMVSCIFYFIDWIF